MKRIFQQIVKIITTFFRKDNSFSKLVDNFSDNKNLWDKYAKKWHLRNYLVENKSISQDSYNSYLEFVGDEWATKEDVLDVIDQYIDPYISHTSNVAELGVGGGRVAYHIIDKVEYFWGLDISKEMLKKAQKALHQYHKKSTFILLNDTNLRKHLHSKLDFIYAFDVLVHCDLHVIWKYLKEISTLLKPSGKAFLHFTNLNTDLGWERFSKQDKYSIEGHFYIVPELINTLILKANFKIIKESSYKNATNFYEQRDYLIIIEKL